jgi:hypothetical protein
MGAAEVDPSLFVAENALALISPAGLPSGAFIAQVTFAHDAPPMRKRRLIAKIYPESDSVYDLPAIDK